LGLTEEINRREYLIAAALDFAEKFSQLAGVGQIALIGSLTTDKKNPKDADLLVTIAESVDMPQLAKLGRQLQGRAQQINAGADIFLSDSSGEYLGRTCHWKDCRPGVRMACRAMNCGRIPHLYDDLQILKLSGNITGNPPLIIYPELKIKQKLPADLMKCLKRKFPDLTI
jgi:predicted nucleotidyltransferase